MIDHAIAPMGYWLARLLDLLLGIVGGLVHGLHQALNHIGLPVGTQTLLALILAITLIWVGLRILGGLVRIVLGTALILLLLRVLMH
ncbi:MAG: hypothetical protein POG24_09995 [Acidocella sp.]|nr:hypothetical protein [Acidocella sp.]